MRDVDSAVVLAPRCVSGGLAWGIGQLPTARPGQYSGVSEGQKLGRVLIVDDDPFTRTMLRDVVQGLGFEVTGSAATFAEGLTLARQAPPDVALIDLDLGEGPTGIDLAHGMRRTHPDLGVVFLSTYVEPRLLGSVPRLPPGAIYLTKQEVAETAVLGDALMSAATAGAGGEWSAGADSRLVGLSDSQIEVMRLVAAGYSNAEIARRLVIEEASVEKAVMRLIRQLDIKATRQENQRVLIAQAYSALSGARFVRRD
jgi:DNA-binding NarL/FixJ family response regulator